MESVSTISLEEFDALINGSADSELSDADHEIGDDGEQAPPPPPPSPTAIKADLWTMRHAERLADRDDLKAPLSELDVNELADLHAITFEPEFAFAENPEAGIVATRSKWMQELAESSDFATLHNSTQGNLSLAEIAVCSIGKQWREYRAMVIQNPDAASNPISSMVSTANACREAAAEVGGAKEALSALGLGGGGGADGKIDPKAAAEMFKRIRKNRTLRRILELAGRYRRLAQTKQFAKQVHGIDDVVGIELAGDIGRLIPSELSQLSDEDLELDALRRIAERQAMCRNYRGLESVGKGPIVVCVDESGSMDGEPIQNAKAMALALAWVARHQKRWCALVGYSGGTEGTRIALPPDGWDMNALAEWLEHFYSGGTTMDVPLAELPTTYWDELQCPKGKTDVIIITDAIVDVPQPMELAFNQWKKREDVKALGIILGREAGDLAKVCDRTWCIRSLSLDDDGGSDVIGEVLSI